MKNDSAGGWFRLWNDMIADPKWRAVARRSKRPLAMVIAVAVAAMSSASLNREERGRIDLDPEQAGALLDIDADDVTAIVKAFRGLVTDDEGRFTGWEKRQPASPNPSTDRVHKHRAGKAAPAATAAAKPPKPDYSAAFEAWWPLYPRKDGKAEAAKSYGKAIKVIGGDPEQAHALLRNAVKAFAALNKGEDRKYIPHAATWLNGRRWQDDDVVQGVKRVERGEEPAKPRPVWAEGQSRMLG